ncbi:hypothetical protein FRC00_004726 [Tulasnella sp. 408]|nr:hypothetical protein FRC00_004726 [Tulasnella sp. 408]
MPSEKAIRYPPKSSVVEETLAMLLESIQEQNLVAAPLNDQRDGDSYQSEIERLDCLAEDRILAAESVLLAARRSAAVFLRRRNALVPMHRLPSEVLALILLESLDFENGFDQTALQSLAQVAHRWWEIIKSQPRFWTCVLWPGVDMASNIPKAKTLPIQLFNRQDWLSNPTDFLERNIKSLLQTHADRWFKISIVSDVTYIPALFTEVLEQTAFSRLEVLRMVGVHGVFHVEICRLERLREAQLSFIPCSGHGPDPTNPAPLLTHLYLQLSPYESYPISCLASFLRHCPDIQRLDILDLSNFEAEDDTQSQSPSPICLPALRSLSTKHLSSSEAIPEVQILGLIRCPNLANLNIRYDVDPDTDEDADAEGIDTAGVFRVLRASSQLEQDALPMTSAVRNIGDSVYFDIVLESNGVRIRARNRGAPGESCPVDVRFPASQIDMKDLSRDIVPYLTSFEIPIELTSFDHVEQDGWGDILDRFRNVVVLEFRGNLEPVTELLEALSQPASSLPHGGPRAPRLETLKLPESFDYASWTPDIHEMSPRIVKMLEKRRGLFRSAGMVWPSEFQVRTNLYIFNEDDGVWTRL